MEHKWEVEIRKFENGIVVIDEIMKTYTQSKEESLEFANNFNLGAFQSSYGKPSCIAYAKEQKYIDTQHQS
jgi:hypothetical protein